MSGSWMDRVQAGGTLKPADLANALRDLTASRDELKGTIEGLRAAVAALDVRVAKCEGPTPVKAIKAEAKQAP